MTRAALAVLVALALAGPAVAATGHKPPGVTAPPVTEQQKLNTYLQTARAYWPQSACAGREQITLNADIATVAPDHAGAAGWGDPDGCRVWLRGGMDPGSFCLVLAHELGHTAGAQHTGQGIMNGERMEITGPCVDRFNQDAFSGVWYATVARLPGAGRGWHIVRARRVAGGQMYAARKAGFLGRSLHVFPVTTGPGYVSGPDITPRQRRPGRRARPGHARTPAGGRGDHRQRGAPSRHRTP